MSNLLSFLLLMVAIGKGFGLFCSICGSTGLPGCSQSGPLPTKCPDNALFCVNSTVQMTGYPLNILRSCVTTLPLDYTGNKCLTANSSSLKASKCACDFNGCNMDPMMTNMSLNDFSASWSNDTRTNLSSNYTSRSVLSCSQCGSSGQPTCTSVGPSPTFCPNSSFFCLNSSLSSNGIPVNIVRSCAASLPAGYASNSCFTANSSTIVSRKCSCDIDGCNAGFDINNSTGTNQTFNNTGITLPPVTLCSQCGHPGQPVCTSFGPLPTVCPIGTFYCLNSSWTMGGVSLSSYRSCGASLPSGYVAETCLTANSSSIVTSKCACGLNGCNIDSAGQNWSEIINIWSNWTIPNITNFGMANYTLNLSQLLPAIQGWQNLSQQLLNLNLTGISSMNRTANETLSRLLADFMNTTYGLMTIMSQKNFSDISNTIKPYMYVMNANMIGNQSQFLAMVSSLFGMLQNSYGVPSGPQQLFCAQCGYSGQPACNKSDHRPNLCPLNTSYCLNSTLVMNGIPLSVMRSCAATLPQSYVANNCLRSNASKILVSKCACNTDGCNMDTTMSNVPPPLFANWEYSNDTNFQQIGFNRSSLLQSMDVWKNFSHHRSNFNFTELIAEFRSLNETDQLELINDIIVGNSTDDMLAGQSLAELINKTGGLLPFMLASASNTTNITLVISKTLMRAFSTGVEGNSSGFQMQLLSFWIKEFFDTIPSQTQSDQPSNTTTTKKSGVSSPSSASLLTFVIIVSTKILYY